MKKFYIAIFIAISLVACRRENLTPVKNNTGKQTDTSYSRADTSYQNIVTVAVDPTRPGNIISPAFEGLSFEAALLVQNPEYLNAGNSVFIQLIKNLGPGILRIGGGTSDKIAWTGSARNSSTPPNTLTTTDIDQLSAFSKLTGWPVLFGLNLGSYQVAASANEAAYIYNSFGSNLYAFQFGNEPNYFSANGLRSGYYAVNDYLTDWDTYYTNIKPLTPQASFAGPDVVQGSDWISAFAGAENSKVKLIDGHYYLTGPATDPSITYQCLLPADAVLPIYLQGLYSAASKYGLPFRVTECNNIWGGGKAGVSDIFASALWALDFMWTMAENNGQGINFHDGEGIIYSPLTMLAGSVVVHPEYYAMLAFRYASAGGTLIPAKTGATNFNCSAYACVKADNSYTVTLINREEKNNITFNIQVGVTASSIQIARLTAPSITSTANVTFAGSATNANGAFTPGATVLQTVNQKNFSVNIPAGSAAVVTIR
jgi:hypothetical protein